MDSVETQEPIVSPEISRREQSLAKTLYNPKSGPTFGIRVDLSEQAAHQLHSKIVTLTADFSEEQKSLLNKATGLDGKGAKSAKQIAEQLAQEEPSPNAIKKIDTDINLIFETIRRNDQEGLRQFVPYLQDSLATKAWRATCDFDIASIPTSYNEDENTADSKTLTLGDLELSDEARIEVISLADNFVETPNIMDVPVLDFAKSVEVKDIKPEYKEDIIRSLRSLLPQGSPAN